MNVPSAERLTRRTWQGAIKDADSRGWGITRSALALLISRFWKFTSCAFPAVPRARAQHAILRDLFLRLQPLEQTDHSPRQLTPGLSTTTVVWGLWAGVRQSSVFVPRTSILTTRKESTGPSIHSGSSMWQAAKFGALLPRCLLRRDRLQLLQAHDIGRGKGCILWQVLRGKHHPARCHAAFTQHGAPLYREACRRGLGCGLQ